MTVLIREETLNNYQLIVALQKFDVLKTNIYPRSEALRENMLVLRTINFSFLTLKIAEIIEKIRAHSATWQRVMHAGTQLKF